MWLHMKLPSERKVLSRELYSVLMHDFHEVQGTWKGVLIMNSNQIYPYKVKGHIDTERHTKPRLKVIGFFFQFSQ